MILQTLVPLATSSNNPNQPPIKIFITLYLIVFLSNHCPRNTKNCHGTLATFVLTDLIGQHKTVVHVWLIDELSSVKTSIIPLAPMGVLAPGSAQPIKSHIQCFSP